MVLLGDEFGGNLDITGDGNIGGEEFLCEKFFIAQIKAKIQAKHFTFIGLTNLLGEPIFRIVIIEVKERLLDIWDGTDLSKETVGDESDEEK